MNNPVDYWYKKYLNEKQKNEGMIEAFCTEYEKGRANTIAEIQKPEWSEEDEKTFVNLISYGSSKYTGEQVIEWLNSLKQRMGGK